VVKMQFKQTDGKSGCNVWHISPALLSVEVCVVAVCV
jgi:hypothetical protein